MNWKRQHCFCRCIFYLLRFLIQCDSSDVEETLEILSNVEVVGDVVVSPGDAEEAVNNAYVMYIKCRIKSYITYFRQ